MIPKFDEANLEAICNILGATTDGLTGSEIGAFLARIGVPDPEPSFTKRHRLFHALKMKQDRDGCGNNVGRFIEEAMKPVHYHDAAEAFETRRANLNTALAFAGHTLRDDGKLEKTEIAKTIPEAQQRARRLSDELQRRGVHPDVLRFCKAELLQDNFFHAVFEATKSVADKIRQKSGLSSDGSKLVDQAFGIGARNRPVLAFNPLRTPTEQNEHQGLANLLRGMFGVFRNTTGHAPKITWLVTEQDALDLMSLASLLHRRLDAAVRTTPPGAQCVSSPTTV